MGISRHCNILLLVMLMFLSFTCMWFVEHEVIWLVSSFYIFPSKPVITLISNLVSAFQGPYWVRLFFSLLNHSLSFWLIPGRVHLLMPCFEPVHIYRLHWMIHPGWGYGIRIQYKLVGLTVDRIWNSISQLAPDFRFSTHCLNLNFIAILFLTTRPQV